MSRARTGFTLMEVAVTIVIVGIALLYVLDGLNSSTLMAAHTRNLKLARDLGRTTLAQIESGILRDELETGMTGTYAEEGYEEFHWEVAVGDDALRDTSRDDQRHDSWAKTDEERREEDEDEDAEEPFEKVRVRVTFPRFADFPNELTLERWMPWQQVYGSAEGDDASKNPRAAGASGAKGGTR